MSTVKHYIAESAETFVEEAQGSHYFVIWSFIHFLKEPRSLLLKAEQKQFKVCLILFNGKKQK